MTDFTGIILAMIASCSVAGFMCGKLRERELWNNLIRRETCQGRIRQVITERSTP
jgi:hypothetical protein